MYLFFFIIFAPTSLQGFLQDSAPSLLSHKLVSLKAAVQIVYQIINPYFITRKQFNDAAVQYMLFPTYCSSIYRQEFIIDRGSMMRKVIGLIREILEMGRPVTLDKATLIG